MKRHKFLKKEIDFCHIIYYIQKFSPTLQRRTIWKNSLLIENLKTRATVPSRLLGVEGGHILLFQRSEIVQNKPHLTKKSTQDNSRPYFIVNRQDSLFESFQWFISDSNFRSIGQSGVICSCHFVAFSSYFCKMFPSQIFKNKWI